MKRTPLRPSLTPLPRGRPLGPGTTPLPQHKVSKRFAKRRDPAFRKFIRGLPCAMLGHGLWWADIWRCDGPVECAHLRSRGAGGDDVGNCIPLCRKHHRVQHNIGAKTFAKWFQPLDLPALAAALRAAYKRGEFA